MSNALVVCEPETKAGNPRSEIRDGLIVAALFFVLLLGWAGFMAFLADRKKSELLSLFAIGLAYYTSVITNIGLFTLYSNLVLTIAAIFFLVIIGIVSFMLVDVVERIAIPWHVSMRKEPSGPADT